MKRSIALFFSLACIAGFGCSSSSSTDGGTATTIQQACTDISSALCTKYDGCAAFFVTYAYGDVATCQSRAILGCTNYPSAPGSTLTTDQIETCAKALQGAACDVILNGGINSLPECNIKGTLDNGKPCASNFQCSSGFCPTGASNCGTCAPTTKSGDACVNNSCSGGLTCVTDASGANGKCLGYVDAGADCGLPAGVCKS